MPPSEEWDWPPRRQPLTIEATVQAERIVPTPRARVRPRKPWATRCADRFSNFVFGILRIALAIPLAILALGCLWLISAILSAP